MSLVTSVSRVFGYVRDAALAAVLGAGLGMDAFAVAFRLANLFRRLVAEGAMSAAFVPVFVEYRGQHTADELWDFARKFFYTLALVAGLIVLLEIIFAPFIVRVMAPGFSNVDGKWELTVFLTRVMAPYLVFVALAAFLMGVLNAFGRFAVPALSPVFFNVIIIVSAFSLAHITPDRSVGIAIGVLIGGVLQFLSQVPSAMGLGMQFKVGFSFRHPAIRKVGTLLAPSIFGIGIVQINLLVDSLMASFLREGSVSQLYYADRVMELVLGIFIMSLTTVILPDMSRSAAAKNMSEVKETLLFSVRSTMFVAIPATVGLFLLADPITHVLFERGRFSSLDTERTSVALAYYALGLFFISSVKILVSAFYALQDTKTPVKVAAVSLAVNAFMNWVLMQPLKQGGIALATSIAGAISVVQLAAIFQKKYGSLNWSQFRTSFIKVGAASGVMGIASLLILRLFQFNSAQPLSWKITALFGTIVLSILVYLAAAWVLKMDELRIFRKLKIQK